MQAWRPRRCDLTEELGSGSCCLLNTRPCSPLWSDTVGLVSVFIWCHRSCPSESSICCKCCYTHLRVTHSTSAVAKSVGFFGGGDTNWRWEEWSTDVFSRCSIINILSAGSKYHEQQQQDCTHENSHSSTSEHAQLRGFELSLKQLGNIPLYLQKEENPNSVNWSWSNGEECNLCSHHGKFCKNISLNNHG